VVLRTAAEFIVALCEPLSTTSTPMSVSCCGGGRKSQESSGPVDDDPQALTGTAGGGRKRQESSGPVNDGGLQTLTGTAGGGRKRQESSGPVNDGGLQTLTGTVGGGRKRQGSSGPVNDDPQAQTGTKAIGSVQISMARTTIGVHSRDDVLLHENGPSVKGIGEDVPSLSEPKRVHFAEFLVAEEAVEVSDAIDMDSDKTTGDKSLVEDFVDEGDEESDIAEGDDAGPNDEQSLSHNLFEVVQDTVLDDDELEMFTTDDVDNDDSFQFSYERITYGESDVVFVKEETVHHHEDNDDAIARTMIQLASSSVATLAQPVSKREDRMVETEPSSFGVNKSSLSTTKVRSVFVPANQRDDLTPLTVKLLHVPSAHLGDLLSLADLAILSQTSRYFRSYCRRMMLKKRNLVDEPFVFGKTLRFCPSISHLAWTSVSSRFVSDAILSHALRYNLTTLILTDLDSITNSAFEWMLFERRRVRLKRLELRNLRLISDESLLWVSPADLECLHIERCPRITEEAVVGLFGPQLTVLHLKSFQYLTVDGTITSLVNNSNALVKHLDVSNSRLEVGFVSAAFNRLARLEVLDANYTRIDDDDDFERCSSLRRLTVNGCEHITDGALSRIPLSIEYLNLSQTMITDEGMVEFTKRMAESNLRRLFIAGCALLTSDSLVYFAQNCVRLRELGCSFCGRITDDVLDAFPGDCALERISLVGCMRISFGAIKRLISRVKTMEYVRCSLPRNEVESFQVEQSLDHPGRVFRRMKTFSVDFEGFQGLEMVLLRISDER